MHQKHRKLLPHYLHILFDLCVAGATSNLENPINPETEDPPSRYLELAKLVIDQVLTTVAEEAHLLSEEHQISHAYDPLPDIFLTGGITIKQPPCIPCPYPPAELVHLATVSFNLAVDFYEKCLDEDCRRWARRAIRLAESMDDDEGRKLASMFRRRLDDLFCG